MTTNNGRQIVLLDTRIQIMVSKIIDKTTMDIQRTRETIITTMAPEIRTIIIIIDLISIKIKNTMKINAINLFVVFIFLNVVT